MTDEKIVVVIVLQKLAMTGQLDLTPTALCFAEDEKSTPWTRAVVALDVADHHRRYLKSLSQK